MGWRRKVDREPDKRFVDSASPRTRTAVIGEKVEGRQQRASQGFVALLLAVQLDAAFHQFGAMMKCLIDQVFGGLDLFAFGNFHGGSRNHVRPGQHWDREESG